MAMDLPLIEHGRLHGLAVQLTELEDVADFDAARDLERTVAGGARVSRLHVADISRCGLGQITAPVGAGEMHVILVRPQTKSARWAAA